MKNFINSLFYTALSGFLFSIIANIHTPLFAQTHFTAQLIDAKGAAVAYAKVYWLPTGNSTAVIGTETDSAGLLRLPIPLPNSGDVLRPLHIVVQPMGLEADTFQILEPIDRNKTKDGVYTLQLRKEVRLATVEIAERGDATRISRVEAIKTEVLTETELQKAACCNLSESFETNATVDVQYADAVTGVKEIQMLGLAGTYTQILTSNLPFIRGLNRTMGLGFIPGTWVEAINVSKGAGSVVNGYESIAGQINTALREPLTADRLFLNLYANTMGRMEANLNLSHRLTKRVGTLLLLHTSGMERRNDMNGDRFMDLPMYQQFNVLNTWQYNTKAGFEGHVGVQAVQDSRWGGSTAFGKSTERKATNPYGTISETRRIELSGRNGYVWTPYRSLGLQSAYAIHNQHIALGLRDIHATERQLSLNLIYQDFISTTDHIIKIGASFMADDVTQQLDSLRTSLNSDTTLVQLVRNERVTGGFTEYTWKPNERFTAVAGVRVDYHNLYGWWTSPRLHLRYALTEATTLRLSGGKGYRVANAVMENMGALVSSRQLVVAANLQPEIAWNYGLSLQHNFRLAKRDGRLGLDFYRTDFVQQTVMDMDYSPRIIAVYNLQGKSYAHALQADSEWEVLHGLRLRLAYKWYDVQQTVHSRFMVRNLIAMHRFLGNVEYSYKRWRIDATIHAYGRARLPHTEANPEAYRLADYSTPYSIVNGQLTYDLPRLALYIGVENVLNWMQPSPIVAVDQPYSPYFDASMIWGPVMGRVVYVGLRYKIPYPTTHTTPTTETPEEE